MKSDARHDMQANTRAHCAHYMVLLGPSEAPRALLFNGECHYLAEVFDDDGMVVDQLVRCSTVCPKPADLMFDEVRPAPAAVNGDAVRCFALG